MTITYVCIYRKGLLAVVLARDYLCFPLTEYAEAPRDLIATWPSTETDFDFKCNAFSEKSIIKENHDFESARTHKNRNTTSNTTYYYQSLYEGVDLLENNTK